MDRNRRFENKVCIVTGGSSGIGKACAMQFASEGAKVVILDRKEDEGKQAVADIEHLGGEAIFIRTDVAQEEDLQNAVKQTVDKWGKIDVVVNDAAFMTFKPLTELLIEEWDKVMAINIRAVFILTKYCLPYINNGAIINISSVHAHETSPNVIPYASSKGAIESFTRGMCREYPSSKVRTNCIAPGAIDTPMLWNNPNVKDGKEVVEGAIGKPEDIANAICFLASDEAAFINGTTLVADGGRLDIL